MRLFVCSFCALAFQGNALAQPVIWSAEMIAATSLIDRGEQLADGVLTAAVTTELPLQKLSVYGALQRIQPVGTYRTAFDEELDYSLGLTGETSRLSYDVSVNRLTFPGQSTSSSTEWVAEIVGKTDLNPTLTAFYDSDLEDTGAEFSVTREWQISSWTAYVTGRLGAVKPGGDSATRSYAGIESGLSRRVSENAALGFFARFDASDEESFVDRFQSGAPAEAGNSGTAIGLALTLER